MADTLALPHFQGRRVLITGASGFVGPHVVSLGIELGAAIGVLARRNREELRVPRFDVDITDASAVNDVIDRMRPEAIIHLAAAGVTYGSCDLNTLLRTNVLGLENVLRSAACKVPGAAVAIAGSGFEYGRLQRAARETDLLAPMSAYGVSKAAATLTARLYSDRLAITVLRLFSIYGPGERPPRLIPYVIEQALRGEAAELTPGDQVRDYTFIGDIPQGFWHALAVSPRPGSFRILNVGSGRTVTVREFVELIQGELETHGISVDLRFGARSHRDGEIPVYSPAVDQMRAALGWNPPTDIETGLRMTVASTLKEHASDR